MMAAARQGRTSVRGGFTLSNSFGNSSKTGRSSWTVPFCVGVIVGAASFMAFGSRFSGEKNVGKALIQERKLWGGQEEEDMLMMRRPKIQDFQQLLETDSRVDTVAKKQELLGGSCDVLASCKAQEASCGTISACGGQIACGSCLFPETCGGSGTPNKCGCRPITCASLGRTCGKIPDGCGGVMECGGPCQPTVVTSPGAIFPKPERPYRIGYFANWAQYNKGARAFFPEDIETKHFTHLIFVHAYLDGRNVKIKNSMNNDDDDATKQPGMWRRFSNVCRNSTAVPMVSIGGWDYSVNKGGAVDFPRILKTADMRKKLITDVVGWLEKYNFQGVEWWWEVPGVADTDKYVSLLKETRAELDTLGQRTGTYYWQAVAVKAGPEEDTHDPYPDKESLADATDWISVMAYGLHVWEKKKTSSGKKKEEPFATAHAPLFDEPGRDSVATALEYWEKGGVPRSKLTLGIAFNAYLWKLASDSSQGYRSPASEPGKEPSVKLPFAEIEEQFSGKDTSCGVLHLPTWTVYAQKGDLWASYDDERTVVAKVDYTIQGGFAGVAMWTIDMDNDHVLATAISKHLHVVYPEYPPAADNEAKKEGDRVLVASSYARVCASARGDNLLAKSLKNKVDYARMHGMKLLYNLAVIDSHYDGMWSKQPYFKKLLPAHPEVEWFLWVDSDAFITDMSWDIPWDKYKDYNMVVPGFRRCVFSKTRPNWCCINAGIFILRNCQWSLDFLDAWLEFGEPSKKWEYARILVEELSGRDRLPSDDQSALMYLIRKEYEKYGKFIYLEQSYDLHGYWKPIVKKYDEIMESAKPGYIWSKSHRAPFITHFVGCKMCGNGKDSSYGHEECFENMERAFNFADNQVILHYGLQHVNLSSPQVQPVPAAWGVGARGKSEEGGGGGGVQ